MQRVNFPGLSEEIANSRKLFVNSDVICSLDRRPKHEGQLAVQEIPVYDRKRQVASIAQVELAVPNETSPLLFSQNGSLFFVDFEGGNCLKIGISANRTPATLQFKFETTTPWEFAPYMKEQVFHHLENGKSYKFPAESYSASFIHSDRIFMLQSNLQKVLSIPLHGTNVEEHLVNAKASSDFPHYSAHVVHNTVFLHAWNTKWFFRLDLTTFVFDEITDQLPEMSEQNDIAFDGTFLYATSPSLGEAELFMFDLGSLVHKDVDNSVQIPAPECSSSCLDCPICMEPFETPKVFPKCGHSICGQCEAKITVINAAAEINTLTCPECRVNTVIGLGEQLPTNWALKRNFVQKTKETVKCADCNEYVDKNKILTCEFCTDQLDDSEVLVCGLCVVANHAEHITQVKPAVFADKQYRNQKIGSMLREKEDLIRMQCSMTGELTQKISSELDVFIKKLDGDYEAANDRVRQLMDTTLITRKMVDKEAEKLTSHNTAIATRIEELETWKTNILKKISELNNK